MTDPTAEFFEALGRSRHQPLLRKASGTVRFDLESDDDRSEPWLVTIAKGDVAVSRSAADADCVAYAEKRLFDALVTGRRNAMAALLRNELSVEGHLGLMVLFQRLFPSPPRES